LKEDEGWGMRCGWGMEDAAIKIMELGYEVRVPVIPKEA
jgi:hypothetical protein